MRIMIKIFGCFLIWSTLVCGLTPHKVFAGEYGTPFRLSLYAGMFYPKQKEFRDLYGGSHFPLAFEAEYRFGETFAVLCGFGCFRAKGGTKIAGVPIVEERYSLSFTMYSILLGANLGIPVKKFRPFVGAGLSYNFYSEEWDSFGLLTKGETTGYYLQIGTIYHITPRLGISVRASYLSVPTGESSPVTRNINFGGMNAAAGLSFHF